MKNKEKIKKELDKIFDEIDIIKDSKIKMSICENLDKIAELCNIDLESINFK